MSGAVAHGFPYVVKKGETVAELAERLYGRIELERIVIAANGLGDAGARGIVAGMRLEIPAAGYHKMAAGESWRSVASELLGASHRGDVLARLNDAEPWVPAVLGREIVVPYNLRYVASSGDTTESVAYRFMGRRDDGFLVASYNELHRASLAQGQVVLVPLVKLGLSEAGRVLASSAGAWIRSEAGGAARKSQDDAEPELARFTTMLRRGDYVSGVVTGARLLARGTLTAPQEARVHALLTEAFAALDERGLAADACAAWRAGEPGLVLDPVMLSPKIVAACLEPGRPSRSGADDRAKP
ncbi:MAG: LysM domain-containing protein [Myxococcales bacterium]|nr:LysM domain-containing protein [Myxococcales bacterium]